MADKKAKILVVEDDPDVRQALSLWLTGTGYAVVEAEDGRAGLAVVADEKPDAVLLDLRLPVLDGFGVLEALARQGGEPPPVIVISGQDEIAGVVRAFRMGAADYLQKPVVSFDLLGHALEAVLEREHLSRAVRLAETRYFNLVQNLPLLVFVLDADGELAFINKFCRTLLGHSRGEALTEPGWFLSRVHPEDRERVAALLRRDFSPRERARTEECRFVHKNGATIHALLRAIPAARPGREGEVASIEGIVVDITDRVELERFVVQEEKLKTLGAISAEVAHEIRNPLFSIAGFAHRLQARLPENREASIILAEARRLEDILDRISTYLHPVDLRPRQCSLSAIATAALEFLAPEFSARGVTAETKLAPGLPELRIDPDLLTQVVTSLVRFAARHLSEGGRVRLASSRHARFVHLDVAFAAAPVPEPDLLFLPFQEGEERMGLPLAYRIVKNMGGSLTFSQIGPEAAFTVQLPLGLPGDPLPPPGDEAEGDEADDDAERTGSAR
ncbi:response regulator [Solidesulfovibrio sp.]|uniref:ATP-binding response regulator n=1 Tax=Solidesulfovibrio sp. TaxID=2910990 RepID=UPI00261316D4|nr:response regulator [Solidesulfovibrio sp.]